MSERVSDERLAVIHAERPHLAIQDDEFQRLAMDLSDARAELAMVRPVVEAAKAWRGDGSGWPATPHALVCAVDALLAAEQKEGH